MPPLEPGEIALAILFVLVVGGFLLLAGAGAYWFLHAAPKHARRVEAELQAIQQELEALKASLRPEGEDDAGSS